MTDKYSQLVADLAQLRRQWRRRVLFAGCLLATAALLAVLLVTVAADNLLRPGPAGRWCMALLLWGVLSAGVAAFVVRRWLERRRDDFFAVTIERKHPELHNLLVNALQLGRETGRGSPRLVEAIVRDAAVATADLELADCLDRGAVNRAGRLAAAGAAVLAIYAAVWTPQFVNGLMRVLLPSARIAPYSATRIVEASIKPGNVRVPEGATVNIEASVTGVIPRSATLFRRAPGKPWHSASMQSDPAVRGLFASVAGPALDSFEYYVAAGDGRSLPYHLTVVKRPQVEKLDLTYSLPPYAAQPPRPVPDSNGDIAGIAGTTVELTVKATKPLREASLVTEGDPAQIVPLAKTGDDRTWTGTFVIWSGAARPANAIPGLRLPAPARYSIHLLDTEGFENSDPLWHSITLARDQSPSVVITAPGRDVQLKPDETVNLAIEAKDDYGLGALQVLYRVNEEPTPRVLAEFPHAGPPALQTRDPVSWKLADTRVKAGDLLQYWAVVLDRNDITGPGRGESRRFTIFVVAPQPVATKADQQITDYAQVLEDLLRLQGQNRAETAAGVAFETLVGRQVRIRALTGKLARAMENGALPLTTVVQALDELNAGLMADAVHRLESGRDTQDTERAAAMRAGSLPVQDQIIEQLRALLARLQRNEQARETLRKLAKSDKPSHQAITEALAKMVNDLDRMLADEKELDTKFEKLPKRALDELSQESKDALQNLESLQQKWAAWAAGKVDELTKLPTGFVDDFGLRPDVKRIFEEIEAAKRQPAQKMQVALEDLGAALLTKMKEDLEVWLPDTPDFQKWVQEEPLGNKPMEIPEMPLPDKLEDMIGDLLQQEEDFDQEADDVTSGWADNLDQAGWGATDGAISSFSAKGRTGNDLPNSNELTGRSGDGRRGKSSGQMVGNSSRALKGRKTPARVTAERYEPGNVKPEAYDDPAGATGGGKKTGMGQRGLQGGTPPDFVRDLQRLSEEQSVVREKAERVAQRLDVSGASSRRLSESIELMKSIERDYRDLRYEDAARKRRVALGMLDGALTDLDQPTGVALSRARQLPAALREDLLQATDEGYPAGYESLLKSYYRALSETEK